MVNEEVLEALKKQYGFDKPMPERYMIWLRNIVHLDFGESFTYQEPVIDVIASKFPVSLQFGIASLILSYIVRLYLTNLFSQADVKMTRASIHPI